MNKYPSFYKKEIVFHSSARNGPITVHRLCQLQYRIPVNVRERKCWQLNKPRTDGGIICRLRPAGRCIFYHGKCYIVQVKQTKLVVLCERLDSLSTLSQYGFVNCALESLVLRNFGEGKWLEIK